MNADRRKEIQEGASSPDPVSIDRRRGSRFAGPAQIGFLFAARTTNPSEATSRQLSTWRNWDVTTMRTTPQRTPTTAPSLDVAKLNGGVVLFDSAMRPARKPRNREHHGRPGGGVSYCPTRPAAI